MLLVHFIITKEIVLVYNSSPYEIGGVLLCIMEKGEEKPIAYISRTLTTAEKTLHTN